MERTKKTCPKCGRSEYLFRNGKTIVAAEGHEAAVETKYRCKVCEEVWKVRIAK